jgi:hypothetical protein
MGKWKLVPVEPTGEMLDALQSSRWMTGNYRAMLAAAPLALSDGPHDPSKVMLQALEVLELWQEDREPLSGNEWPIRWTDRGTVAVALVPPRLLKTGRASRITVNECISLGVKHHAAIKALRAALSG